MEKKQKRTTPVNKPPKDIKLNQTVNARVRSDQKEFIKATANEFGKKESEIVRFSLDAVKGIFPPDFFPSKEELEQTRKDVLALADVIAEIRRLVYKASVNENQIARAINSGRVDELGVNGIWHLINDTNELMDACRDIYEILETNMEYVYKDTPEWL